MVSHLGSSTTDVSQELFTTVVRKSLLSYTTVFVSKLYAEVREKMVSKSHFE